MRHWNFLPSDPLAPVSARATCASSFFLPRVDHRVEPHHPYLTSTRTRSATLSICFVQWVKKKKKHFIFLCMPFILFAIFKKKKSNFEFQNSKIQKKKKRRKRKLALTSKKKKKKKIRILNFKIQKKKCGIYFFDSIFMSRD